MWVCDRAYYLPGHFIYLFGLEFLWIDYNEANKIKKFRSHFILKT